MRIGCELLVEVKVSNPLTGTLGEESTVTAKAYHPDKVPQTSEEDRDDPDDTITLTWDAARLAFYGAFETNDWEEGDWTLLVESDGELIGHVWKTETFTAF